MNLDLQLTDTAIIDVRHATIASANSQQARARRLTETYHGLLNEELTRKFFGGLGERKSIRA
jgi:hypothetical protein